MARPDPLSARIEQWRPDLLTALARLYSDPEVVAGRLVDLVRAAHAARPAELLALDLQRIREPDWFQRSHNVGYAAYADRFAGTLAGVAGHAEHLAGLGVTYLHLMPLLQPRPTPNDGGYAVQDYRTVRPDLGTVEDLQDLATTLRGHGISLCLDLVLNHVAREHEWAAAARAGDPARRDYFHVFADRTLPDAYERTLPEVFPDFAPGQLHLGRGARRVGVDDVQRLPVGPQLGQPGRRLRVRRHHPEPGQPAGWRCFRLDAIAFIVEAARHQLPEPARGPRRSPRCCARSPGSPPRRSSSRPRRSSAPRTCRRTSASGEHAGKVSDLAYHNSLMVQVWSMLACRDVTPRHPGPAAPATSRQHHVLDHLPALPRRHRLGHRRR